MTFEIPNPKETVEIGGKIYGHPSIVMKFPPNKDIKRQLVQKHKRRNGR